ncbi:MAG: hypothetical protein HY815_02940 [Candidatus Riflebacteria bacterium]|nr:hypothetical protein [Candidatus Riflebacteria bacterium]
MADTKIATTLPSLDEALEDLKKVERKYNDGIRLEQTKKAMEANERFARDRARLNKYLGHLDSVNMFTPIYGLGNTPNGIPVALPPYVLEIMDATSRVLTAVTRRNLQQASPQYLIDRMPKGWLTPEMAQRLYTYFLTHEPDMGFDVLISGKNSYRGMSFEEFKKSGDMLQAKLLEAQSVDTYYGWVREYIRGSRLAGLGEGHQFTWSVDPNGRALNDAELDREVISTLLYGYENEPESCLFLEVDPEKQASGQNLIFMANLMSGGKPERRPAILDPRDLEFRGDRLFATKRGQEREIKKVISRIVDVDLVGWLKERETEGYASAIELFRKIYSIPHLFKDLSKHLCGFYLIDKSSLTDLTLLGEISIAPKTEIITPAHMERYQKDPKLLKQVAIKPLHGMSAKGVVVSPTLMQVEEAVRHEQMLVQETIWATPIQPNICPDIADPDVQVGICSEARLVLQAGSPAVAHNPHKARLIAGLSRSHFQSKDPERKIKNDPRKRGWYSNMGSILAVKAELGITTKNDAGIGMAPIYVLP